MARTAPSKDGPRANKRGAARLAAVQALYQMDLAATPLNDILGEFEAHWLGQEGEGDMCRPAAGASFLEMWKGVVDEQRWVDPRIEAVQWEGWPLVRIETVLRASLRAGAYVLDNKPEVPARVVVS